MRPLSAIGGGLVLVGVDFRTTAVDLLPDPLGWLLVLYGLWRLSLPALAAVSLVGFVASFGGVVLPYHHRLVESAGVTPDGVEFVTEVEVLEYDAVHGLRLLAMVLAATALGAVMVGLVRSLGPRARPHHAEGSVRLLGGAACVAVLGWVVPRLTGMARGAVVDGGFDPVWNGPASSLELAGILAIVALGALLLGDAREPWGLPPGERRVPRGTAVR